MAASAGSGADPAGSMQKRQAYADKADDHNRDNAEEDPPTIVVGVLGAVELQLSSAVGN
jgi:hypothetical protein